MNQTYALHNSFFPFGPFRHSGLCVTLQLAHRMIPAGGLPAFLVELPAGSRPSPGLRLLDAALEYGSDVELDEPSVPSTADGAAKRL